MPMLFSFRSAVAMNVVYLKSAFIGETAPNANVTQKIEDGCPRTFMTSTLARRVPCFHDLFGSEIRTCLGRSLGYEPRKTLFLHSR